MDYTYNRFIKFHVADMGEYMKQEAPPSYKEVIDVSIEIDGEVYNMTYEEFKAKIKGKTNG
jgi:hypothetical protein